MEKDTIQYTDEQLAAVAMMRMCKVGILTGGPGTGKTTTLKKILQYADDNKINIMQCAPTGKAAKRMMEATGYPSETMHRLLQPMMNSGQFIFGKDANNPIEDGLLIVDEMSMVDNWLAARLLEAVNVDKTKILFVGDDAQLPSVGAGAVLRDMIVSKVIPRINLTKIHRNSGDIVKTCHAILNGIGFEVGSNLNPEEGHNIRHISASNPQAILEIIKTIVVDRMPTRGYNSVWDVQVISPVNTRGKLSCSSINEMLQPHLNPNGGAGGKLSVGDKVINTRNEIVSSYRVKDNDLGSDLQLIDSDHYIVNGDLGTIIGTDKNDFIVKFENPTRTCLIPQSKNNLLLAYCLTCHRMQGSEAKVVIIPFHSSFAYFLNRQWVYTAISRASEICITIGDVITFKKACQRPGTSQFRETRLKEKLIRMVQDERDKSKSIGGEIESGPATAATEEKERQIDSQ